jgi:hypothetical protein
MHTRGGRSLRSTALLLVAVLLAACSSAPQSGVTESAAPPSAAPTSPPTAAPSEAPTAAPSEAIATPAPTPEATPGIPPKPGKVTFKEVGRTNLKDGATRVTNRVTWTSPAGVATDFSVYGVTLCLRESRKNDGKPCVVKGMRIPQDTLKLLATVPGSARSVDVSWKEGEAGPGPYAAILVRASNDAGDSIFTIAWSTTVCWGCVY